ncbi:MAG: BatD family protein [Candidatus Omnitrophota bacterium]
MKRSFITLLFFMMVASAACSADNELERTIEITAKADKAQVHVGDRIKLELFVEGAAGFEVEFPEKPEKLGDFSFVRSYPIKTGWGKAQKRGREYLVSVYDTGTHVIPPIQVRYKKADEDQWSVLESPQVPIEVKSFLTGEDKDIRDLKGLIVLGGGPFRTIAVLISIVAVGIAAWILWRRKRERIAAERAKPKSAQDIACEQLRQLKAMDLPGQGRIKEYYVRLSDIVRHYLEGRFSFRAPEMTTEEFMESVKNSPEMLKKHKELLGDFLFHCDMVKFAKYGPTPLEMLDSFQSAQHLVDQTSLTEEGEG